MDRSPTPSFIQRIKTLLIGRALSPEDEKLFHRLSLIAFFAWVGLGADGLSSSCYGPEEAFLALGGHHTLGLFVALAAALTIFVISTSYSQIIELFPSGGGGYLVASKLLSPGVGMISGCALLLDYVLTITISIASGADALFSFLPSSWHPFKLGVAIAGVMILALLNLRGVKESVLPLVPIFLTFVITHALVILYALATHWMHLPAMVQRTVSDFQQTTSEIGLAGMAFLLLRAYSMGAGTYTGIEAVSNGLPILREPRVQTGKRTMRYMAVSLAFTVVGLMVSYILYGLEPLPGKTLNAVLFERITTDWGNGGHHLVWLTLLSEAALLLIAAQAGFLDGPRVIANMALDRWFPSRFTSLSDRFVTQNGILIMGGAALAMMLLTQGSVRMLVVLYSINVFITFVLSQLGMVRHWWRERANVPHWRKKLLVNGLGLVMTALILVSVTVIKFHEGGWITIFVTSMLVGIAILIKRHYLRTAQLLRRLDSLVRATGGSEESFIPSAAPDPTPATAFDSKAKTAVLLVNGFNGLGLHTLLGVIRLFGGVFRNFVFIQVGVIDAGNFKGAQEVERLRSTVEREADRYVQYMRRHRYYAESRTALGTDVVEEVAQMTPAILDRFPGAIFFGGQLVFPKESFLSRWLHNHTVFAMQRRLYAQGIPVVILPIRV